ncbi:hypothetical protein B0H16DRAFT_1457956 [Mycena metata]|uniref:Uncharacterized protein n=1 Tax=Mycena metata TaxID=1033252 RepID=A0AAD7J4Q8_9AGAR|nr:hypothetical protein B0H16DRAFT_1457956 [Mycena metata]
MSSHLIFLPLQAAAAGPRVLMQNKLKLNSARESGRDAPGATKPAKQFNPKDSERLDTKWICQSSLLPSDNAAFGRSPLGHGIRVSTSSPPRVMICGTFAGAQEKSLLPQRRVAPVRRPSGMGGAVPNLGTASDVDPG